MNTFWEIIKQHELEKTGSVGTEMYRTMKPVVLDALNVRSVRDAANVSKRLFGKANIAGKHEALAKLPDAPKKLISAQGARMGSAKDFSKNTEEIYKRYFDKLF